MKLNSKNVKENLSIVSFVVSLVCGWGLTVAGFCVNPVGEVSNSVLWILGQSLLYCSTILGISGYYRTQLTKIIESKNKTDKE